MNEKSNVRQVLTRPRPGLCEMSHDHIYWSCDQKKRKVLSLKSIFEGGEEGLANQGIGPRFIAIKE